MPQYQVFDQLTDQRLMLFTDPTLLHLLARWNMSFVVLDNDSGFSVDFFTLSKIMAAILQKLTGPEPAPTVDLVYVYYFTRSMEDPDLNPDFE